MVKNTVFMHIQNVRLIRCQQKTILNYRTMNKIKK